MRIALTRRLLVAGGLASLALAAQARARSYELVADGSRITFAFFTGGTRQTGTVPVQSAKIEVDTSDLVRSSATVTADVREVTTGLVFFTEAIKSPDLLDAQTHPIVRFASRRIRLGARGRISEGAVIEGDLTLRGVTRPISLQALLSRPSGTAPDDLSVLYIRLTGALDRRDYGASGFAGLAENRVELDILAEIRASA